MSRLVIGIDAGGTNLRGALVDEAGEVVERRAQAWTPGGGRDAVLAVFSETIGALADDADAVGVGIPATVDVDSGSASACPHLPLAGFGFGDWLRGITGLPVFVDNDSTLALLGEARLGAARGVEEAVMLTIGTGIGGGILSGGRIVRGASGAAGEPGHMSIDRDGPACRGDCPGRGCLETYVSGSALAEEGGRPAHEIVEAAHAGDADAVALVARMGERLGVGIANLLNLLEPEVVVVGGGFASAAGALLLDPATRVARARALPPAASSARIVGGRLGEDAGMIGAALLAFDGGAA